jgi:hypothetical protein
MKRLRHPVRAVREPFGTAGLIVACIAMVLALTGAAFAAKGALTGKQKKEVEKIAKKFAGKPGAPGAPGAAGKDGTNGTNGANGAAGKDGADGKSVEAEAAGAKCPEGGTVFKIGGVEKGKACNGVEGEPGPEGALGTAGTTLPPGATETGTWGTSWGPQGGGGIVGVPISFPIPLAKDIDASHVHIESAIGGANCAGSSPLPTAKPGELCLYESTFAGVLEESVLPEIRKPESFPNLSSGNGSGKQGAVLRFEAEDAAGFWFGTFAVTGCDPVPTNPFPCP